jgi:CHAT domain-containing protein
VLATLWSVEQTTAAAIFRDVYARMETCGRLNAATAAAALHHAVRIQREAHLDQPMRWALFTHTGP